MFSAIAFCLLLLIFQSVSGFVDTGNLRYNVELHVFSGRMNPSWTVTRENPHYSSIAFKINKARSTRLSSKLGYGGFSVEVRNAIGQRAFKTIGAGSDPRLELLLLRSNPKPLEPEVGRYVTREISGRLPIAPPYGIYRFRGPLHGPRPLLAFCRYPRFDPERWNLEPIRSRNNCYNYATNRRTDTFAQPGRGSGAEFQRMYTEDVLSATVRDGLILMPLYSPHMYRHVCYIALVIWPGVDFHFYRLDDNKLWSHKPGRTPAKNTDDSGNLITDPRYADRGNYVVFAGFLGNHPRISIR